MVAMSKNQRADWAAKISGAWRQSVEKILACGRLLTAAQKKLGRGEFGLMVRKDLPFKERTAQRLMKIAADKRLATHVSLLPASWGTLHVLSQLSDAHFKSLLTDELIHPDMERSDAERIAELYSDRPVFTGRGVPESQNDMLAIPLTAPSQPTEAVAPAIRPRPAADRIEEITDNRLFEHMRLHNVREVLEALLRLERAGANCDLGETLKLLLDPENVEKLDRVRKGIAFAIRLKGALDQAGLAGNRTLRLISLADPREAG